MCKRNCKTANVQFKLNISIFHPGLLLPGPRPSGSSSCKSIFSGPDSFNLWANMSRCTVVVCIVMHLKVSFSPCYTVLSTSLKWYFLKNSYSNLANFSKLWQWTPNKLKLSRTKSPNLSKFLRLQSNTKLECETLQKGKF